MPLAALLLELFHIPQSNVSSKFFQSECAPNSLCARKNFLCATYFSKMFPNFPRKISSIRPKFLMTFSFFSHRPLFGNFYLLRTQNRHFFAQLSSEIPVFVVSAMCAKTFLKENVCTLQLFFCARVSRPVCERTRAQLRGNIASEKDS